MIFNIAFSNIYVALLLWIYDVEFTHFWVYMRFEGEFNTKVFLTAFFASTVISFMLPTNKSARGYILIIAHYFFFLPSIVYLAFNSYHEDYIISLVISVLCIYFGSMVPIPKIATPKIKRTTLLSTVFFLISIALMLQIAFGGLNNFNLNMEAVYEFRGRAAAAMPALFGYLFSNVANVLIPSSIVLSLHMRSKYLGFTGLLSSIFLFGMSQHKSIIFVALMVFGLYFLLQKTRNLSFLALLPITLVTVCALELVYYQYVAPERQVGIITSYFVRRTLLVPPMLDVSSVELFSETAKYYWSTSRLGLGIASNPHGVAAPFLMGIHFFDDPNMSANPGNIGSGYSHAGLLGVLLYSLFTGFLISFVNTIGGKVGHSLVAAISIPVILMILTSTDLTTALLTHGLLMLVIILMFLPRMPHHVKREGE